MKLYVITHGTKDYGEQYVVRIHVVSPQGSQALSPPLAVVPTLDEARDAVPEGCVCLGREESDDPVIVETWL